ncbi:unnamed protein product [Brassica rapa]|uniref:RNase H type-1 domain-containing protein n=3 Tax=Brassica TaxID=3705 RepID=A0A8S9NCI9_BRACR|nr:hypothetical protein F2Q68_00035233 [Brassica cretica]KAF3490154.1 hypothetical protein F2Q69_00054367 [Brassica cretica]CAF2161364.1 unnamed protein product [Brassica napus]CAG7901873.1 unnamed protein product [Brassica rapa]
MAQSMAVRAALFFAKAHNLTHVWIQSDSLVFVLAINSKTWPMELYEVLMDIALLSSTFSVICFSFIPRHQNSLAN